MPTESKDWVVTETDGACRTGAALNEYVTKEEALQVCKILIDIANRTGDDKNYIIFNVKEYQS